LGGTKRGSDIFEGHGKVTQAKLVYIYRERGS